MYHLRISGGLLLLCFLLLGNCDRQREREQTNTPASEKLTAAENEASEATPHPLSIEGLRKRVFPALEIKLQNSITANEGLEAREFSYNSDGNINYGLLERPSGEAPSPEGWPVIIVAHGYIPPDNYSTSKNYRSITQYYAKGGFLVLKPDYRGHDRSKGSSDGATASIDYSIDVLNLIKQVDSIPDADTDNVFLYGHSMGGEIGLRVLTVSKALRGATLWAPVTKQFPENRLYFIRKKYPQETERFQSAISALFTPDEYDSLSPGNYLDSIDIPILIHHGTQDESVPFEWSTSFREALDEAQVDYTFYEYPGEDHNISASYFEVMDKDMRFFKGLIE